MRVTVLSVLVAGTVLVGCNRSEATITGHAVANPVSAAREPDAAPVARAGRKAGSEPAPEGEREIIIPLGTLLRITLDTPVGSDTSRVEESVTAHLARPVRVQGRTVLAAGTRVSGVVTLATRSGKIKGRAHVAMRFNSLTHGDEEYAIRTAGVGRTAQGTKQKDTLEIGAPAVGGAIIGALVGGKKGALVGTAVGGGAGTAAVLSTRGKEVRIGKGAALTIRLTAPLTVHVRD